MPFEDCGFSSSKLLPRSVTAAPKHITGQSMMLGGLIAAKLDRKVILKDCITGLTAMARQLGMEIRQSSARRYPEKDWWRINMSARLVRKSFQRIISVMILGALVPDHSFLSWNKRTLADRL